MQRTVKLLKRYRYFIIIQVLYNRLICFQWKMKDYPAMIVGCKYGEHRVCGRSNGSALYNLRRGKRRFLPLLENALQIERQKHLKNISIGSCAEDDAANKILQNNLKITSLYQLNFTIAIRPRTGQKEPYCQICKNIFGL